MLKLTDLINATLGQTFHSNTLENPDGSCAVWRVNGKPISYKRNIANVRLPIKRGLWDFGYLTKQSLPLFHRPEDCPHTHS